MSNYDERQILSGVLDCGVCDVDFLINNINEFELDFDDIKEESEMLFGKSNDINELIYTTFNMAGGNFLAEVNNLFVDKELSNRVDQDILEDFDMTIYTNYLDSGFDSILANYNLTDISESNLESFLQELYDDEYLFLDNEEFIEKIQEIKLRIEHETDDKEKEKKILKLKQYASYNDDDISYSAISALDEVDNKDYDVIEVLTDRYDRKHKDDNSLEDDNSFKTTNKHKNN